MSGQGRADRPDVTRVADDDRNPSDPAPVLIARCDADRRYTFVNAPYAARFGLHPREVVGRHVRDVLGGAAYAAIEGYITAALAGARVEFETELAFDPELDAAGRVVGFVAAVVSVTAARRATAALRASEERFARFMGHLPGLAWIKDGEGRYVYANDAAVAAFGTPRDGLYGRTDEEVFPPATATEFRENDRRALAAGTGVRTVEALAHGDGAVRHSVVSKFPIPGPDGRPPLVGGVAIDVTEEMRTRAVLEESEERFRATFEQAAVGIAHVAPDGRWLRVNRRLCDIVGYTPDELMGLTFQDITHPDDLAADLAQLRQLVAGQLDTYAMEKRYFRKDGRTIWINLTVSLVRTPAGGPKYLISVVEDVTARKAAQDALRESEGRLRTLSNNLPRGAVYQALADADGRRQVLYVSAGVERLFGVTPAEVLADATAMYGLIHEEDLPRVAAREEAALRDGTPFDCEFRSRTRRGGLIWVHARSAPRPLPTGQVVWEGIVLDATERRRAEEALRDADRRKDQWVMMLAHELRNPLAPVRTAVQVLRAADADRATVEKARGVIDRQVGHMTRIIDDLLDVSRLLRGRVELRAERTDLGRLARTVVDDERPAFDAAGVRLGADLPELPAWVNADPTRLTQVLDNLLHNAAKFTDRGGTVAVRVAADAGRREAVLAVRDTGSGIDPDLLPRLFEAFTQADTSLDRAKGGLGLGLSVVRGLVELHGGTVAARSDGPGRGAEFVVRLPLQPEPAAVAGAPRAAGRPLRRLRVLVVEDNRDAADSLKMLLEAFGHDVAVAYTGPDGVATAAAWRPDAVVCDIGLPGLDGYGVARELRRDPATATARLIAVTGYGGDDDRAKSREAGFDAHLTKPADPTALQTLLAADLTG